MSTQAHQASMISGRSLVFAATVALHAAAITALLAWRISEIATQSAALSMQVSWPEQEPRRQTRVALDRNAPLQKFTMVIPAPRDPIAIPEEPVIVGEVVPPDAALGTESTDPAPVMSTAPDTPLRYQAVRPSDDYYPPQAIRLEQQGMVVVRTCVDAAGRLTDAPRVVTSSRSRMLDLAAVSWASEALHFTPATRGGAAIAACKDFRVNFKLH